MKTKKNNKDQNLKFYNNESLKYEKIEPIPFFSSSISAGFPSPADDFLESSLNLNSYLIPHPTSTFFVKVSGRSMEDANIFDGDILIVDRSLTAQNNKIVLAIVDGEFTVKRIQIQGKNITLIPESGSFTPIEITDTNTFEVWGVVTYVIHQAK